VAVFCIEESTGFSEVDAILVAGQLDRKPRGSWSVRTRCIYQRPAVIATAPQLEDGTYFPTLFYLTCPWLVLYINGLESTTAVSEWAEKLATEPDLRSRMIATDARYRAMRASFAGGTDPTPDVGIAGQRSPLSTKCIHAHVATYLAGLDDPVGESVVSSMTACCCPSDLCRTYLEDA